jgi:(2Fe-2S) ferredoxin
MVIYPDGVWYRYSCMEDITEILQSHLRNGKRVERLLLDPDKITLKH